jgi:GPH family glycoside/pentoside/hexuronide:cation symporter
MFFVPLINIRETPDSKEKAVPPGLLKAISSTFKNPAFPPYIGIAALTLMGIGLLQAVLPFVCTQILERPEGIPGIIEAGKGKDWVGYILGAIFVLSVLLVPMVTKLSEKLGKKKLLICSGGFFTFLLISLGTLSLWEDPAIPALIAFLLMPFPVCAALVLPNAIYADVVDLDEKMTGFRREGLYNGATSIIVKLAQGMPPVILVVLLTFGDSRSNPLGIYLTLPAAGVLILLGVLMFRKHPINK